MVPKARPAGRTDSKDRQKRAGAGESSRNVCQLLAARDIFRTEAAENNSANQLTRELKTEIKAPSPHLMVSPSWRASWMRRAMGVNPVPAANR
ncbi:hypothetical protein EYF80_039589 [Liparis tanakae]|uniref:Uncharacterized protein n=1 Tax=Liparis tanakae TaxID=230148 RepID=A0A4Z2G9J8_9TELE|nr:hypothetical protein EYF80_039589 [Liparis tanakae]